jgi:hypothetical protein
MSKIQVGIKKEREGFKVQEFVCTCVVPLVMSMLSYGLQNLVSDGHRSLLYTEFNSITKLPNGQTTV